jgi:hypothetical protein
MEIPIRFYFKTKCVTLCLSGTNIEYLLKHFLKKWNMHDRCLLYNNKFMNFLYCLMLWLMDIVHGTKPELRVNRETFVEAFVTLSNAHSL